MDQKVDLVIDSIKKLLALGVTETDIVKELAGVGISESDALELIQKAKAGPVQGQVVQIKSSSSKDVFDKTVAELSMDDQIVTQLNIDSSKSVSLKQNQNSQLAKPVEPKRVPTIDINPSEVDFGLTIKQSTRQEKDNSKEIINPDETKNKISIENNIESDKNNLDNEMNLADGDEEDEETIGSVLNSISNNRKNTTAQNTASVSQKNSSIKQEKSFSEKSSKDLPMYDTVKQPSRPVQKPVSNFSMQSDISDSTVDEFWKKGVVVAVNSRLTEMKKLKEDIDSIVQEKVDSSVRKELQQFKILLESQKDLMISSNKSALEEKQKEITFIIDAKIAELKQYNKQLSENLSAIETAKLEQQAALQQISSSLDEARKTKAQLIIEMNSEMFKSKSSAQKFLDSSDKHMKELDERVNRTLELEKNIAEGMLESAEQKIEGLTIQRADELIEELQVTLNKLKASETQLNPELIQQKIQVLDDFKKQFVNTMKDNITEINVAINELNERNATLERAIQEKMLVLDAKMEELTKFEKNFTATMEASFRK